MQPLPLFQVRIFSSPFEIIKLRALSWISNNPSYLPSRREREREKLGHNVQTRDGLESKVLWWVSDKGIRNESEMNLLRAFGPEISATHSSILAWKIQGTEEPELLSMGSHRVGHDWKDLAAAAIYQSIAKSLNANIIGKRGLYMKKSWYLFSLAYNNHCDFWNFSSCTGS